VWAQPRSLRHLLALPLTNRIYRDADAVVAYGEHVRRFVAARRGRDSDVFVAPQSVEADLFARALPQAEVDAWRARHRVPAGPLVLYCGRFVPEKGVGVLLDAWHDVGDATLVLLGDGPLADRARSTPRTHLIPPQPRNELPLAYAAAEAATLPSVPTPLFREPWGLVCNEAMHQGKPVIATTAVGAAAGGLVRDHETGLVVPPADPHALASALNLVLRDEELRTRLGRSAQRAVQAFNYEAMVAAFRRAL
jgi:glycosyltransferase involved in cell wall biosynthesis